MFDRYTLHDVVGTSLMVAVFSLYLVAPGYAVALATDLFGFRRRSLKERLLLSVPISVVVSTILSNIVGRYLPASAVQAIFLCIAALAAAHGLFSRAAWQHRIRAIRRNRVPIGLALLWALGMIACLVDVSFGGRLYVNSAVYDQAIRIAFINSVLRSGVPPVNPFFFVGGSPVVRYYYYWYGLCSYPARLLNMPARYALYASSIWSGFALAALIPLYLKDFLGVTARLRKKTVLGLLLLAVTGLDLLPVIYEHLRGGIFTSDMELWDPTQVTAWQEAFLWVPHHVASLVACLIGFLALWSVRSSARRSMRSSTHNPPQPHPARWWIAGAFAGLAFAAASGLSVYVTLTFAIFLVSWGLRSLLVRNAADFFLYLWAALVALVLSLPLLRDLLPHAAAAPAHAAAAANPSGAATGHLLGFGWRQLPNFLAAPHFLAGHGASWLAWFAPLGVVVVYALEFGYFAIVGVSRFRQSWKHRALVTDAEIALWHMLAVGLAVITFVRSTVIANNDLAFRSAMIAQFVLLLWAVEYTEQWWNDLRRNDSRLAEWPLDDSRAGRPARWTLRNLAIASALVLGLAGTAYGVTILRTYVYLDAQGWVSMPAGWLPPPRQVGTALFQVRSAYGQLDRILPRRAIVQYNPAASDYLVLLQYDNFQAVDAFPDCGSDFGGDPAKCLPAQNALIHLFRDPDSQTMSQVCHDLSIDVLVATSGDPAWNDPASWVWTHPAIVSSPFLRAIRCP